MRRSLPRCLLAVLVAYLAGCGESPNRPSVVTDRPVSPPKSSARYIQVPWDISLFFNIPGGAVVADATTAATSGNAAAGDNLTGTYSNTNGFGGTISGVLTGSLDSGNFDGTLSTVTSSGCVAERRYSGPLTSAALNWSPGSQVNDCGGTSPLTVAVQAAAAPPTTQPPCSYSASVTATSFPAAGGTGTANVTAGTGCTWFANPTASFVTVSAGQGSGNGSVQFTVAANPSTSARTATLVIAGQSFTITQAGAPAPACTYVLNATGRTFEAAGGSGGVDMRAPAGCAWTAQSNAPWLTITGGAAGNGNGTISFAVAANPDPSQRIGSISAAGNIFTVTQAGVACSYTVESISATEFPNQGGTATATVTTQASCGWGSLSNVPWITTTGGGTGSGTLTITVAPNQDPATRSGVLNIAGRPFTITQAAACAFTVTPTVSSFGEAGGSANALVLTTNETCTWTAASNAPWITLTGTTSGTGTGSVPFAVARNTGAARSGTMTIATRTVTISQAAASVGTVSGTVTAAPSTPISGATVTIAGLSATTGEGGTYTLANVPIGSHTFQVTAPNYIAGTGSVAVTFTTTLNVTLNPAAPVVTMTFTPNPVFPNPADLHCGQPVDQFCWTYGSTIRDTAGATLTVTAWEINLYDQAGGLYQHNAYTQADFARFYNGATTVPANGAATGGAVIWFNSPSGGTVEIIVQGTDIAGRSYRFVSSPRLAANPAPIPLAPPPPGAKATSSPPPRPVGGR